PISGFGKTRLGALNAEMGRYIVKLPDIGEGTTEAEIVKWHVTPGQEIREEDPLVDIMTDKATVEIPAPVAGTVVTIEGAVGEKRPVGSLLVTLDVVGAGNVAADRNTAAVPARAAGTARASPKKPLTPTLSPQAGRGSLKAKPRTGDGEPATSSSADRKGNGGAAIISLSRTAGEGAERSEAGEGVEEPHRPSPSHRSAMGPSLSRDAREGLFGIARRIERSAREPRSSDIVAVSGPRHRQCGRRASPGECPLRRRGRRAAPPQCGACRDCDADRGRIAGAGVAPRRSLRSVAGRRRNRPARRCRAHW